MTYLTEEEKDAARKFAKAYVGLENLGAGNEAQEALEELPTYAKIIVLDEVRRLRSTSSSWWQRVPGVVAAALRRFT